MSGRKSRDKGARGERALVRYMQDRGFAAERVPLSGAAGGKFGSDVEIAVLGDDWRIECKTRANGFATFYGWLEGSDALVVRADRQEPLVVLPLRRAVQLLSKAEKYRGMALRESEPV